MSFTFISDVVVNVLLINPSTAGSSNGLTNTHCDPYNYYYYQ